MKHNKYILEILLVLITICTSILNVNIALADENKTYDGKNIIDKDSDIISSEQIDNYYSKQY